MNSLIWCDLAHFLKAQDKKRLIFFFFFLYIILNSFFINNIALKWLYKQMGELILLVSWESALGRSIIH